VGTISATANVNPAAIHALYAKSKDELDGIETDSSRGPSTLNPQLSTASPEELQAKLDIVREVFARKSWPSMIAALKQAIAIYGNDPAWARVRPPLVELTPEQAKLLAAELKAVGFAMPPHRDES
jgi:4-hydroxy-tetrahydrodipicolinate synthase